MAQLALGHGNPETPAVWDQLAPSLEAAGRDPLRLSPPGFGAAVPADFQVTPTGYRDWLIGELERFDEPADVLGHDWGGVFVILAAAARRPGLGVIARGDNNVGTLAQRQEACRMAGAATVEIDAGHWWMTGGDQEAVLSAFTDLWAREVTGVQWRHVFGRSDGRAMKRSTMV